MRNLILLTFATMGLLFTSCGEFHYNPEAVSQPAIDARITDTFSCQVQYLGPDDEVLYIHDQAVCVERIPDENCFYGQYCTRAHLDLNHKILRGEDTLNLSVSFDYDHYLFVDQTGHVEKAQMYACDNSSVVETEPGIKNDYIQPECLTPQLGTYDVSLLQGELPVVHSHLFQTKFKLDRGDTFAALCELESTKLADGCD